MSKPLTPRELEILQLSANGHINKDIAGMLGISEPTVKNHLMNIRAKMGTKTTLHAVAIGLRNNLIK